MSEDAGPPRSSPRDRTPAPPLWVGRLASVFVLLAMAALVLVPLLVQRRVDQVQSRVEDVADPARTLVRSIQYDLAREAIAVLLRETTGAAEAPDLYREALNDQREQFPQLQAYVERMGGEAVGEFHRFRILAEQWQERVSLDSAASRPAAVRTTPDEVREEMRIANEVLQAGNRLDQALVREAARTRGVIRGVERFGVRMTLALGALALLAAGTVAWLARRMRQLATVATLRGREAELALAETARVTEARARLLRGVSHDVKNPLGAARGYAELLEMGLKGPLNEEQRRYVQGISRSIDGALAIIADLLDLARADSGGLSVERVAADLSRVAFEAAEDHRPSAAAAGHAIECTMAGPVRVYTDPGRVRQVLGNLLSNAIKYTPAPGRITVRAERAQGDADRPGDWAVVCVTDTGPGIPPDQRESIFDEFSRLHDGTGIQGHGLGLAISRRVARLLGGELDVAGEPGQGATFTLWLPLRDEDKPHPSESGRAS